MLAVTIRPSLLESVSAAKRERRGDDVVIRIGERIIAAAKVQGNTNVMKMNLDLMVLIW